MVHLTTFSVMMLNFTCVAALLTIVNIAYLCNKEKINTPKKLLIIHWGILIGAFLFQCVGKAFGWE